MALPEQGQVYDGYRFMGGDPKDRNNWQQAGPIDVSSQYGDGATQLPNGDIVRYGPRGGMTVLQQGGQDPDGPGKLTEGQGKSVLYGGMMRGAERDYQQARKEGYDPSSLRNQAARVAGIIPFDGDFFGRLIRDDVSDRGNQAELRWAEGNLRQLTGAAATNAEIARVAAINFDRGNDELSDQRYRTRAETYDGTRYAAGPGSKVLGEYPGMPGRAEIDPKTGLPEYEDIATSAQGVTGGFEIGPDGRPIAPEPQAPSPGGSPDAPIDISGMSADDLLGLQPGQYIKFPDGRVERLSGAPRVGAAGEQVAPGVFAEENTPEGAVADRRDDNPILRRIDAGVRGAADVLSFGLADEIAAAGDAAIGRGNGETFGDRYRNNVAVQRGIDEADQEDVPVTRIAGQVGGGLTALPSLVRAGAPKVVNALRAGVGGAGYGGAYGFGSGEGDFADRSPNALVGAGVGAATGAAAGPVANVIANRVAAPVANALQASNRFIGRQVGRAGEALGVPGAAQLTERATPNALRTGMGRMAERSPQELNALNANVERFRAEGIDPTFADVVNDGGRGTMRALATRQTPARQQAREFAANRAEGLQDRVSAQARRTISDDPRSPMEIRDQAAQEGRRRAAPLYEEAYAQPIEVTEELQGLLQTPAGQAAMQRARRIAANERREINLDQPDMQTLDYVKRGLDDVLEGYRDKTSGKMVLDTEGRAVQDVLSSFRGELDRINPSYASARSAFADSAKLQEAATLGERFMNMEPDQFAAAVNRLSPDERKVARAAARRAVERAAGTQGQAPGVAQRLSGGREQGQRAEALLDDAEPMQRAMRTELEALRNAQAVNPGQGSQTSMNLQDASGAAGMALDAVRRPIPTAVGAIANRIRSRGFDDQQAQAIVEAAIDPNRTDELISILSEKMTRKEARQLARSIRYGVMTNLQPAQQS